MIQKSKFFPDRQVMILVVAVLSLANLLGCASAPELRRQMGSPGGLEKEDRIEFVPTCVALVGAKEIGRIVEKPQVSMKVDILMILARTR